MLECSHIFMGGSESPGALPHTWPNVSAAPAPAHMSCTAAHAAIPGMDWHSSCSVWKGWGQAAGEAHSSQPAIEWSPQMERTAAVAAAVEGAPATGPCVAHCRTPEPGALQREA